MTFLSCLCPCLASSSSPFSAVVSFLCTILSILSFEIFLFIFFSHYFSIVSFTEDYSLYIVLIPLGAAIIFALLAMAIKLFFYTEYLSLLASQHTVRAYLLRIDPKKMDFWHELCFFQDVVLAALFVFMAAFGLLFFFSTNDCSDCSAPYRIIFLGFSALYILRIFYQIFWNYKSFRCVRGVIQQVRRFQELLDDSAVFQREGPIDQLNTSSIKWIAFPASFLLLSIILISLCWYWYETNECEQSCDNLYFHAQFYTFGASGVEACSIACGILYQYQKKISGMEHLMEVARVLKNEKRMRGTSR